MLAPFAASLSGCLPGGAGFRDLAEAHRAGEGKVLADSAPTIVQSKPAKQCWG